MNILNGEEGYIYFIAAPPSLVKIGFSKNPNKRKREIKRGAPEDTAMLRSLILYTWPNATVYVEKELHNTLRAFALHGFTEWYKDTVEFRAAVISFGLNIDPRPYEWNSYRRAIREVTDRMLVLNGYVSQDPAINAAAIRARTCEQ